jgi:hypothetical protein
MLHHDMLGRGAAAAWAAAVFLVSSLSSGAFAADGAEGGRGQSAHVLIGLPPDSAFDVLVAGQALPSGPAVSSDLGIATFAVNDDSYPAGPISVVVAPAGGDLVITGPWVDGITSTTATVRWRTSAAATSFVEYGLTNSYGHGSTPDPLLVTEHAVQIVALSPGTTYHYRVQSADALGHVALSADDVFETELAPLVITDVVVAEVGTTSAVIRWTTNRASDSQVEYGTTPAYGSATALDPALVTAHTVTLTGLIPGTLYHMRVRSDDHLGDIALSTDRVFETELAPLVISGVVIADVGTTSAVVHWTTNRASNSQVEYGTTPAYGSATALDPSMVTAHAVTLTGLIPGTLYHLRARSDDGLGHVALSGDFTCETAVPPLVMSGVRVADIRPDSAVIEWETDREATSAVEYGTTSDYGAVASSGGALATEHSITVSGLAGGTLYHFRAVSTDGYGTTVASADSTFTTLTIEPTGPPTIESVVTKEESATCVFVTWTTDRPATSQVRYGTRGVLDCASPCDTALTREHAVPVGPVVPMLTYTFVALSACGADTAISRQGTFRTGAPLLSAALGRPVEIVRSGVALVGETTAVIRWVVDRTCSSWVEFGNSESYGTTVNGSLLGAHAFEAALSGLRPGTLYHYRVCAWDGIGGLVSGQDGIFETKLPADVEPPAPPQGLVLSLVEGGVRATWEPNDEPDLLGYFVYRARGDGGDPELARAVRLNEAPLPDAAFFDTLVEDGATYAYVVTAVDQAGNESAVSAAATIHLDGDEEDPPWIEFAAYPNPVRETATFVYSLSAVDGSARVRVVAPDGRLVAEVSDESRGSGVHTLVWNARDRLGKPVGGGVYFCELRTSGGDVVRRKVTVLR